MTRKILQFIFGTTSANICMATGVALLGVAIYFGVNPADGSAVDPLVRDTGIDVFLFLATAPALVMLLVAGDGIVGLALMLFVQIAVYWTLGKIGAFLLAFFTQQENPNGT